MASKIQEKITQTAENISDLENQIKGGNNTEYLTSRTLHIGGTMNDLIPHRIDPVGKTTTSGVHIQKSGLSPDSNAVPHIEPVMTPNLLGDYNLMVANKYQMFVGANGIKEETIGMYEMTGGILSLKGRQVTISSDNEILVDGGKSLVFRGDNINFEPREREKNGQTYRSVGFNGNIGVDGNAIVAGGLHAEGGITTNSITAPVEFHESEVTLNKNTLIGGLDIGTVTISRGSSAGTYTVKSLPTSDFSVGAHTTVSASIPTKFVESNDDLRDTAMACNQPEKVLAKPVDNTGNQRERSTSSYTPFRRSWWSLDDDCKDQADAFDKLLRDISTGVITPDEAIELVNDPRVTRASDSPISETNQTSGECTPCD